MILVEHLKELFYRFFLFGGKDLWDNKSIDDGL